MGRFETAAAFYHFREPYPPNFFKSVAAQLKLNHRTRLLDVACGPGNLVIGFAAYVGTSVAIDIEPGMLRVARETAGDLGIQFLETPIEQFKGESEAFDFITIGRALHWLPREQTLTVFERVLAQNGSIAICSAAASDAASYAWTKKFRDVRGKWSGDREESFYRPDLDEWFAPSRFRKVSVVEAAQTYRFTVDDLIGRALSFSVTSPSVLGNRRPEFEAEVRSALEPFAVDGVVQEEIVGKAAIFRC